MLDFLESDFRVDMREKCLQENETFEVKIEKDLTKPLKKKKLSEYLIKS